MKIELKIPTTRGKREVFFIMVAGFLVFFTELMEFAVRSESDLKNPNTYCGVMSDYFYTKPIRGFATWLVVIKPKKFEREVFQVGDLYILNSHALSIDDKGKYICIDFLNYILPMGTPFVSQIYIDGTPRLDLDIVKAVYLSPPSFFNKFMAITFFVIDFILLINIKRD
ncbi:MAG: hypothetical protein WAO12_09385 [Venatoribacter sp.]